MRYLLDSHIFFWFVTGNAKLKSRHSLLIENANSNLLLSVVSIWELVIKESTGKIELKKPVIEIAKEACKQYQIQSLSLSADCLDYLPQLPVYHKDPFDRILICQAQQDDLIIITDDQLIRQYPVKTI